MAYTEKCRGCMNENKCDYITCRIEEVKEIRTKAIEEFAERLKTDLQGEHWTQFCTMREMIDRIAESMKGEKE